MIATSKLNYVCKLLITINYTMNHIHHIFVCWNIIKNFGVLLLSQKKNVNSFFTIFVNVFTPILMIFFWWKNYLAIIFFAFLESAEISQFYNETTIIHTGMKLSRTWITLWDLIFVKMVSVLCPILLKMLTKKCLLLTIPEMIVLR